MTTAPFSVCAFRIAILSSACMALTAVYGQALATEPGAATSVAPAPPPDAEEQIQSLLDRVICKRCMHSSAGVDDRQRDAAMVASCAKMSDSPTIAIVSGAQEALTSKLCADGGDGHFPSHGECTIFAAYGAAEIQPLRTALPIPTAALFEAMHEYVLSNIFKVYGLKLRPGTRYLIFARPTDRGLSAAVKYYAESACDLDSAFTVNGKTPISLDELNSPSR